MCCSWGHTPLSPEKEGTVCSRAPRNPVRDTSTWRRMPSPPLEVGSMATQDWKLSPSSPLTGISTTAS